MYYEFFKQLNKLFQSSDFHNLKVNALIKESTPNQTNFYRSKNCAVFSSFIFENFHIYKGVWKIGGEEKSVEIPRNYVVGTTLLELRCWNCVVRTALFLPIAIGIVIGNPSD